MVSGDFNSSYEGLSSWMLDRSLNDLISIKHGKGYITYEQSAHDPINCIFVSPSLQISKRRVISFNRLFSDHREIWIDIPNFLIYGFNPPPIIYLAARRLKMKDPRAVKGFLERLDKEFEKDDL